MKTTATRCPDPCGKIRFSSEHLAVLDAIKHTMEGSPMISYNARECNCWHVSSKGAVGAKGRRARKFKAFGKD